MAFLSFIELSFLIFEIQSLNTDKVILCLLIFSLFKSAAIFFAKIKFLEVINFTPLAASPTLPAELIFGIIEYNN